MDVTKTLFPSVRALLCALVIFSLGLASTASANLVQYVDVVSINAWSDSGWGTYSVQVPAPSGPTLDWSLEAPIDITNAGGDVLGTITQLDISLDSDPNSVVTFGVLAGNVPTNFTISSALVSFAPIINPLGTASAGVTVTDSDADGASLTGNFGGPLSFRALYNGGTTFTTLVGTATAPASGTDTVNSGTFSQVIPGAVTSIQGVFNFQLSAFDVGSGTGRFSVVPEPSTFGLLAVGALALGAYARARRRAR